MLTANSPIILAVDTDNLDVAKRWVADTSESVGIYKLGLEFFLRFGKPGIKAIQAETDSKIFLDLKLHDIPNTVGASVTQVSDLAPKFLTVHASGGSAMIASAATAAPEIDITAVTILTSLNQEDLHQVGFEGSPKHLAINLAKLAVSSGAKAIVCSPQEIEGIRSAVNPSISIITPGIRPAGAKADDQKRVMDPKSAIAAGANYLVIGRPITAAANIKDAAKMIFDEACS